MIPVVALVGRPNVGKSTLFNRLTRTRDALVADFPGLTRDRKYGQARYQGVEYLVVDTGGIDGTEEGIEVEMAEQSLQAIDEADVVVFMVDARAGLTVADQAIASHLRKLDKNIVLLANKVDGIDADSSTAEFYALALGDVNQIAATHGRGVNALLDRVLELYIEKQQLITNEKEREDAESFTDPPEQDQEFGDAVPFEDLPIKMAVVGRPNVGKSTLTNRILGEERVVVYDMPGTTRDSIYIPMNRDDQEYIIIDTAGVRRRGKVSETVEKFSVIKTLQAVEDANVVLLVIDAQQGITDQDLSLLGFVLNAGRSLVIVVNKWDGLTEEHKKRVKEELDRRLGFIDFARVHFISALHGTGVGHLYESVKEAYVSATKRVPTSMLTRIMQMAVDDHQPPMRHGRRIKLRYAHAGGYNPPRVVIHGNQLSGLPESYKRYLMNYFRKSLNIMGTPIRVEYKEGDNPYAGRKSKLTLSQERKRKRFMQYHKK